MGWLAPIVIIAKILLQSLWLLKIPWDDALPVDIVDQWSAWQDQINSLSCLKLPRWIHYSPQFDIVEMHGFADASKQAYAAVIYLRIVHENKVHVSLLVAKTRVAPLKTISIPRLELCVAHLLAKLAKHIIEIVPIDIQSVHLWSDSTDVLCWLKDRPSRWPVFVANRCAEILTLLPSAFWHKVQSLENPADVASRGIEPSLYQEFHLWWHGPEWLSESVVA